MPGSWTGRLVDWSTIFPVGWVVGLFHALGAGFLEFDSGYSPHDVGHFRRKWFAWPTWQAPASPTAEAFAAEAGERRLWG